MAFLLPEMTPSLPGLLFLMVKILTSLLLLQTSLAPAGVAQWIEHGPTNQRVTGLIPSEGTYLGCRLSPQFRAHKRQPHIDISLPLFLRPFHSL